MKVFVVLGLAAVSLTIAMFTGTGWLLRQRRRNDQTVAAGGEFGDDRASTGGKGRFPG
jgi:hypothetical protein